MTLGFGAGNGLSRPLSFSLVFLAHVPMSIFALTPHARELMEIVYHSPMRHADGFALLQAFMDAHSTVSLHHFHTHGYYLPPITARQLHSMLAHYRYRRLAEPESVSLGQEDDWVHPFHIRR